MKDLYTAIDQLIPAITVRLKVRRRTWAWLEFLEGTRNMIHEFALGRSIRRFVVLLIAAFSILGLQSRLWAQVDRGTIAVTFTSGITAPVL